MNKVGMIQAFIFLYQSLAIQNAGCDFSLHLARPRLKLRGLGHTRS
jgi:hypothetical protein